MSKFFMVFVTIFLISSVAMSVQATEALDQRPARTLIVIRDGEMTSRSITIKGNTSDSPVEFIHNKMALHREFTQLRTDRNTSIDKTEDYIQVNGTLNGVKTTVNRFSNTLFQKDEYINGTPVDKRVRANDTAARRVTVAVSFDVDRTIDLPHTYDELLNDANFTLRENETIGVSAFVRKTGYVFPVAVNNTAGETIGFVLGFRLRLHVILFDYDTHEYLGVHYTDDFGYGNKLPRVALDYLRDGPFDNRRGLDIRNNTRIRWLSLGYNESLGLDMYFSFYHLQRSTFRALYIAPSTALSLSAVDDGILSFTDSLVASNEIAGFDESSFDTVEDEIVDEVFEESGLDETGTTENSSTTPDNDNTPSTSSLNYNYLGIVILLAIPIVRKKYH